MRCIVRYWKYLQCLFKNGHKYLIEYYAPNGELYAHKCFHCGKVERCKMTS